MQRIFFVFALLLFPSITYGENITLVAVQKNVHAGANDVYNPQRTQATVSARSFLEKPITTTDEKNSHQRIGIVRDRSVNSLQRYKLKVIGPPRRTTDRTLGTRNYKQLLRESRGWTKSTRSQQTESFLRNKNGIYIPSLQE